MDAGGTEKSEPDSCMGAQKAHQIPTMGLRVHPSVACESLRPTKEKEENTLNPGERLTLVRLNFYINKNFAEDEGFEPSKAVKPYHLSKMAH